MKKTKKPKVRKRKTKTKRKKEKEQQKKRENPEKERRKKTERYKTENLESMSNNCRGSYRLRKNSLPSVKKPVKFHFKDPRDRNTKQKSSLLLNESLI